MTFITRPNGLPIKFCKPAPKTIRAWIEKNPEKVTEFDCGGGYSNGFAYDILLAPGWRKGDDHVHTLICDTVKEMLSELRAVVPCDCDECKAMLGVK